MLSSHTVLMLLANAVLVALLALSIYEMMRPGKLLGWFLWMLEAVYDVLKPSGCYKPTWIQKMPAAIYAFITHSLRECFACLGGQLGVLYWWAFMRWPHTFTDGLAMATFLAACIILTYPLNKLKR